MPSDTAIIIRTHFFDAAVEDLASRLTSETTLDVLIVVDETKGFVSIPPTFNKLAFNNDDLTRLELATPQRVGWLCGDYFFYVAREHLTSHHYFWIIEPDVIINADHLSTFFQHFNAISDDLLAISLAPRFKHWSWHDAMSEYVPKVYGCLFPILRLSANAVDYLYRKRKLMSHDYLTTNKDIEKIPNDEAVVASYLVNNNFFKCRDINDVVKAYIGWKTFSGVMPISRTFLNLNKRDDFIYHSVRSGEEFKRAYERFLSLIEDTVQLNAAIEALPQVEAELGSDAVNLYQKRLLQIEKFFHEHGALDKKGISHHHGTLVRTTQRIDTFFFIINSNDHVQKQHQKGFFL
ncbi:hypothetical protein [Rhodoblastus sp.]|uniref:hypothetical protein n=1 Tax=Rhodoblastus sp. TaxID=1962975 RepID=UPI002622B6FB|nr:hypothetical protein [Rhodoblastus sp.]